MVLYKKEINVSEVFYTKLCKESFLLDNRIKISLKYNKHFTFAKCLYTFYHSLF